MNFYAELLSSRLPFAPPRSRKPCDRKFGRFAPKLLLFYAISHIDISRDCCRERSSTHWKASYYIIALREAASARKKLKRALTSVRLRNLATTADNLLAGTAHHCAAMCARRRQQVMLVRRRALKNASDHHLHALRSLLRATRLLLSSTRAKARGIACAKPPSLALRLAAARFDCAASSFHSRCGRLSDTRLLLDWVERNRRILPRNDESGARLAARLSRQLRRGRARERRRSRHLLKRVSQAARALSSEQCP